MMFNFFYKFRCGHYVLKDVIILHLLVLTILGLCTSGIPAQVLFVSFAGICHQQELASLGHCWCNDE